MTATPDSYPTPLRGGVKVISQELRAYLKDADIATTQDDATRSALRQRATQRLANADQMLTYMEGVVDGTADANHAPLFRSLKRTESLERIEPVRYFAVALR